MTVGGEPRWRRAEFRRRRAASEGQSSVGGEPHRRKATPEEGRVQSKESRVGGGRVPSKASRVGGKPRRRSRRLCLSDPGRLYLFVCCGLDAISLGFLSFKLKASLFLYMYRLGIARSYKLENYNELQARREIQIKKKKRSGLTGWLRVCRN
nr:hypothetical protein Iba_chr12aCG12320 [Ipomoea batatas]